MSDKHLEEFSDLEFDVLKEISNIGAGNASTAISKMMDTRVNMQVPVIKFLEFKDLAEVIGGAENLVLGILFGLEKDIDGMMMFIMDRPAAARLAARMLNTDVNNGHEFSEMEMSALQEFGNIVAGSYLAAISKLTQLSISTTIPYMSLDMAGAILSVPAIEYGKVSDRALLIQSELGDDDMVVEGNFILIPTLDAFEKIFSSLGLTQ